ncbi:hypothetical protein QTN25_005210 [Entamoeba marina]
MNNSSLAVFFPQSAFPNLCKFLSPCDFFSLFNTSHLFQSLCFVYAKEILLIYFPELNSFVNSFQPTSLICLQLIQKHYSITQKTITRCIQYINDHDILPILYTLRYTPSQNLLYLEVYKALFEYIITFNTLDNFYLYLDAIYSFVHSQKHFSLFSFILERSSVINPILFQYNSNALLVFNICSIVYRIYSLTPRCIIYILQLLPFTPQQITDKSMIETFVTLLNYKEIQVRKMAEVFLAELYLQHNYNLNQIPYIQRKRVQDLISNYHSIFRIKVQYDNHVKLKNKTRSFKQPFVALQRQMNHLLQTTQIL